jgi:diamine N-acetyltransferase
MPCMLLRGQNIFLRAIEPEDATKVMIWENNPENWRVSGTEAPYSMHGILEYINSIQNFRQCGELRLIICLKESKKPIGTLDLFDANFKHGRAGIGILIGEVEERSKGFASEAIQLLIEYARDLLGFHNLTAQVLDDNLPSRFLFENNGFELVGIRKEWFYEKGKRIDERIYQLCLKK